MIHTIDATNQPLGRLASKIALILRGKINPSYQPHITPDEKVFVTNIRSIKITGNKSENKMYYRHSGYPGGLRTQNYATVFAKHPDRVLVSAVLRMLPNNRTRSILMKNLDIK